MSTRAIVRVQGVGPASKQDTWNIYCHHDGQWNYIGAIVNHIAHLASENDCNVVGGYGIPNIACETDKFTVYLIQQLGFVGYDSAYLTTRNPENELASEFTDIEYLYIVSIDGEGVIVVETYRPNIQTRKFEVCNFFQAELERGVDRIADLFPE
ncbi:hypothetical protein EHM69_10530 [candidate division KSB1 bacterium]|nr:MAG: hypothetical protein EHM69_10530 [candidate division KSB1 bacterium]